MYSKHSALGSRILVILTLETNMASSRVNCREKERHFVEQKRHVTFNFTTKGAKEAVQR